MISIRYHAVLTLPDGQTGPRATYRHVLAEHLEEALANDVHDLLRQGWRPEENGDELRLTLESARHQHLGVETFHCKARLLRRAADRIWPVDPVTKLRRSDVSVEAKLAHFLLDRGLAFARISPFLGLSASRN